MGLAHVAGLPLEEGVAALLSVGAAGVASAIAYARHRARDLVTRRDARARSEIRRGTTHLAFPACPPSRSSPATPAAAPAQVS